MPNILVQAHWSMDTYIARFSLIIYYDSLFYSLGHGVTILMPYFLIMMSDTIVASERHLCQTILQYDITIVTP